MKIQGVFLMCPLARYPLSAGFDWHMIAILKDTTVEIDVRIITNRSDMQICVQITYPSL
jgi:hypothetical protein